MNPLEGLSLEQTKRCRKYGFVRLIKLARKLIDKHFPNKEKVTLEFDEFGPCGRNATYNLWLLLVGIAILFVNKMMHVVENGSL